MFFCGKSTKGKKQKNTNVIQSVIHSIDIIKIKPSCLKTEWGWDILIQRMIKKSEWRLGHPERKNSGAIILRKIQEVTIAQLNNKLNIQFQVQIV